MDREQAIEAVGRRLVDGPTSLTDSDFAEEIVDALGVGQPDPELERLRTVETAARQQIKLWDAGRASGFSVIRHLRAALPEESETP